MAASHRATVEEMLQEAHHAHLGLLAVVPAEVAASLPVDAQGITAAIDHVAVTLGLTPGQRRQLIQPHAVNPAVLHARVFGATPLTRGTVIGAFVDGARVRAEAIVTLAVTTEDRDLVQAVQTLLVEHPLPIAQSDNEQGHDPDVVHGIAEEESLDDTAEDQVDALRDAYSAQEQAVLLIAESLD